MSKGVIERMKKLSILCLSALILSLGLAPAATAADAGLATIVETGKLRVGTSGAQPPFTMVSKDGNLIGFEIDLARLLANAMDVELVLVQRPFPELLDALAAGEVDMVMSGMTMTPERNLKAAFVGPYMVSGKTILTTSATLARVAEAAELDESDIKLATLKSSTSQKFVERFIPKAQLTTTMRYPDKGLATTSEPLTIEPIGVALPPGDSLMLNMVENYLGALDALGVIEKLEERWFEDGGWLIQLP
jgi:polar amino acid transport system substrate-binding protein